jgi:DNA-binding NarL/FixJ family response regulator
VRLTILPSASLNSRSLAEADFHSHWKSCHVSLVKHMKTIERVATIRILVVDDSAVLRDAVRGLLSNSDAIDICGEACNGYEALEKALKLCPDVIVMDIGMPAMDGLEATRRLLRANSTAEVLMFTEHNSEHARDACLQAGARGYLSKAQAADLPEAIRTVASHATYAGSTAVGGAHPASDRR